ncbi:MAG: hypothetical protein ACOCZS_00300 [Verrucomicrobiota bacterium]
MSSWELAVIELTKVPGFQVAREKDARNHCDYQPNRGKEIT